MRHEHWAVHGIYFGVPLSNFFGWFIASLAIFIILSLFLTLNSKFSINGVIFYTLPGIFQCVEDVVVRLYMPALISGIIFIGIFILLCLSEKKNIIQHRKSQVPA